MKRCVIFVGILLCTLSNIAYSYKQPTHKDLSKNALLESNITINTELLTNLGLNPWDDNQLFSNPEDVNGDKINITQLIRNGADYEDGGVRSLNHFYNPITNEGLAVGYTSPDWSLEDNGDIDSQSYSYKDAMNFFYLAMTSQTKEARELNWGKTFETLGRVIHHVQDMAQPDHARDDLHCDAFPCAVSLVLYDASWYEKYTNNHKDDAYFVNLMTNNSYPIPQFDTAREYWTTQVTDTNILSRRGMADYTNRNFVSKDTTFEYHDGTIVANNDFPYPVPNQHPNTVDIADPSIKGAQGQALCDRIKEQAIITFPDSACYLDFVTTPVNDALTGNNETNDRAATYSIFDKTLQDHNIDSIYIREDGSIDTIDRSFTLNEFNFKAAHQYLIPRAVAYSAGLINHFFRGKIDMKPNPDGDGWIIQNLSDEDMQGDFVLYYDHKDAGSEEQLRDAIPGATWNLTIAANSETVVSSYTVPAGVVSKTLVFSGRIGAEENSHAGKYFGGWSGPILGFTLEPNASIRRVVTDDYGNAMVTYTTPGATSGYYDFRSRRYTPATGWSAASLINSNNNIYYNNLVMDADGNALVTYVTYENHVYSQWSKYFIPASGWGGATLVSSNNDDYYNYYNYYNYCTGQLIPDTFFREFS